MWYPFFSVPPVGTITVVFPAFSASRVSSHVSSSMNTVSGACVGVLLAGAVVMVGGNFARRSASVRDRLFAAATAAAPAAACRSRAGRFGLLPRDGSGHQALICANALSILICSRAFPISGVDLTWLLPLTPLFS